MQWDSYIECCRRGTPSCGLQEMTGFTTVVFSDTNEGFYTLGWTLEDDIIHPHPKARPCLHCFWLVFVYTRKIKTPLPPKATFSTLLPWLSLDNISKCKSSLSYATISDFSFYPTHVYAEYSPPACAVLQMYLDCSSDSSYPQAKQLFLPVLPASAALLICDYFITPF